jgi:parallel beta-helix repeat protein
MKDNWMKKGLAVGIILLFVGTNVISLIAQKTEEKLSLPSTGNILYVGGNGPGNYTRIQDAIDDASNGNTVFVYDDSSPYRENVIVNKSINLIGEDKDYTVIDGSWQGTTVYISADMVNISRFRIIGIGMDDIGIYLTSNFNTIMNVTFPSINGIGIKLISSCNNTIKDSTFSSDGYVGTAISLGDSNYNIITGNDILWDGGGIYLWGSNSNILKGNIIRANQEYGIYLSSSDNNIILGNDVSSTGISNTGNDGIKLGSSSNNIITGNIIFSEFGDGIYLSYSSKTTISNNSFLEVGLQIENSFQNTILNNTISGKPLIYLENKTDTVMADGEAGEILLINSDNITIQKYEISHSSIGIEILRTHNSKIINNSIFNSHNGIFMLESSNNTFIENNITSNDLGMLLSDSNSNIIKENNITSISYCGLDIEYSDHNSIQKNAVYGHFYALFLGNGFGNTISNSTFYASGFIYGVWIYESINSDISGNIISCRAGDGLYLDSNSNKNIIVRNRIVSNGQNGISIHSIPKECKDNVIAENNISSNSGNGIYLYYSNNITIIGNIINSNGRHGIFADDNSNYIIINGNNISFNKRRGVYLYGSYHKVINNNFIKNWLRPSFYLDNFFEKNNSWAYNYWGKPRTSPYPIIGNTWGPFNKHIIPWVYFDWHPSQKPYNIP